jgi:hypothetical protein
MAHVKRRLPAQPHLDVPKRQARELLAQWRAKTPDAFDRIRSAHPAYRAADAAALSAAPFRLSDAQLVIAREYSFASWAELKQRITANPVSVALEGALRGGDRDAIVQLLRDHPQLLHVPVRSGNWGPPMSFAANLGRLDVVQAIAALGARDHRHAFDRALLRGNIACARWLYEQGAGVSPDSILGPCETLDPAGLRLLVELGAPFTDRHGDRLAPLAMVLQTYSRGPARKREVMQIFVEQGHELPDTPIMALHRGRADLLDAQLQRDPGLVERRFRYREIYPPELGCTDDGRSGLHGTPVDGTTLLHLAIDFDEQAIFDLLLERGAGVDARAAVDRDGLRRSVQLGLGESVELTLGEVEVLRPVPAPESSQDRAPHVVGWVPVLRRARQAFQVVRGPVRREPLALQVAGEPLDLLAELGSLEVECVDNEPGVIRGNRR